MSFQFLYSRISRDRDGVAFLRDTAKYIYRKADGHDFLLVLGLSTRSLSCQFKIPAFCL